MLSRNLESVRERIQQACRRSGRDPTSVTIVGVTKAIPVDVIRQAIDLGVTEIGENRVQEARAKREALSAVSRPVRWHLVGRLQSNKAKHAVELFDIIHSVDSVRLVETLDRQAAERARPIEVLIQVNASGEMTKGGCRPEEIEALAVAIQKTRHLTLTGLMTMAPFSEDPKTARPIFRKLRELRDRLQGTLTNSITQSLNHPITHLQLSMGMSQDFEVAIEEGADIVRIGTAIFGERTTRD